MSKVVRFRGGYCNFDHCLLLFTGVLIGEVAAVVE